MLPLVRGASLGLNGYRMASTTPILARLPRQVRVSPVPDDAESVGQAADVGPVRLGDRGRWGARAAQPRGAGSRSAVHRRRVRGQVDAENPGHPYRG